MGVEDGVQRITFDQATIKHVTQPLVGDDPKGPCEYKYQACCVIGGAQGKPCTCHLTGGGTGNVHSHCGSCGDSFKQCCVKSEGPVWGCSYDLNADDFNV